MSIVATILYMRYFFLFLSFLSLKINSATLSGLLNQNYFLYRLETTKERRPHKPIVTLITVRNHAHRIINFRTALLLSTEVIPPELLSYVSLSYSLCFLALYFPTPPPRSHPSFFAHKQDFSRVK